jgi:hypothetical protein
VSKSNHQLPTKTVQSGKKIGSIIAQLNQLFGKFQSMVKTGLQHQTKAKKSFRTINKRLRGFLHAKQQKEMRQKCRKFTAEQKKYPPPYKPNRKRFYSILNDLSKSIDRLEGTLKKQRNQWASAHDEFVRNLVLQLDDLGQKADHTEQLIGKDIKNYQATERYTIGICEAFIQQWLKRCNEDYIDVDYRACRELTKAGYEACRALSEADNDVEEMVRDLLQATRDGHQTITKKKAQLNEVIS